MYVVNEMDLNLQTKLEELFTLLDDLECIKKLEEIKNYSNNDLIKLIENYRINPTIENKKSLYQNKDFMEYIKNETELNYLIMNINNKFKKKRGNCESN